MINLSVEENRLFRILVADDSPEIRELLFEAFNSIGYAVTCVRDGLEALACLRTEPYDLLITDYRMPRLDGLALLRRLQTGNGCQRSILITAQNEIDLVEEARQAGATLVLFKPFAVQEIVTLVEVIKDRRTDR